MGRRRWRADETPMSADIEPRSIDLALEPAFKLAGLEVHPATLEVVAGDRREQLEPRIMQVLVALARRRGEVVSRDELNELCWGGRVVGDDAVNRCIGRLRKLAQTYGGFTVETVPRVGYRLAEATDRPWRRILRGRRALAALMALAIVLALGAGLWAWRARQSVEDAAEPRIALMPFQPVGGGAESRAFAARLTDEVTGVLNDHVEGVASPSSRERADLTLSGSVRREGNVLRVRAYIENSPAQVVLWSDQFERPVEDEEALRTQIAVALTETVQTALIPREQKGLRLDPRTQALHLKAAAATKNPQRFAVPEARRNWEQVVARAPRFAYAHAGLALSLMYATISGPPAEQLAYRRRAREAAETAIRIDPRAGAAGYDALHMLDRLDAPGDLARAEDRLLEGLAKAPQFAPLSMRECQFLIEVGRVREGVAHCTRAFSLDPLHAPIAHRHAHALYVSGEREAATVAIAKAFRYHPDHVQTRRVRFEIAAFGGSPAEALVMLRSEEPGYVPRENRAALEQYLAGRRSGEPRDVDRALESLWAAARKGGDPRYLVMGAAVLGRRDDAFAALATPGFVFNTETGFLFTPAAESLRRDPRFWSVAAKRGLTRYWKQRGVWPDFCSDPTLPYDCRKEAARVAAVSG